MPVDSVASKNSDPSGIQALRAEILYCVDDPANYAADSVGQALCHFEDGLLVYENGVIKACGAAEQLLPEWSQHCDVQHYPGHLVMPGFIDTHIHFPQTEMIAAFGEQLMSWLETYTFPTESQFADQAYAAQVAEVFVSELLRNGTTTAMVFASVHPQSVEALFSAAQQRCMRLITGKVMMDRNAPDDVSDTPATAYQHSKQLIEKWHGKDRLSYAVTPRFALTSSPEQLQCCSRLLEEYPDVYLQTHLSENRQEIDWVLELFPEQEHYLGVYDHYQLVKKRAVFAHGIHVSDQELAILANKNAALSHCPTSNLFLGSGLFPLRRCQQHGVQVSMGTDVGGGSSFSMFHTLNEAYKVQQLQGESLSAFEAFYLATLGGARVLDMDDKVGTLAVGSEADFVLLDYACTPFMAYRQQHCKTLHERLFALMMLADDRALAATYVLGNKVYDRTRDANKSYLLS